MDSEQFRKHGKEVIDFIADFYDNVREHEITPSIEPGHVAKSFPKDAPEKPDNWQTVFEDFSRTILPGVTSWNSPQFHGYYPSGASYASILGSILTEGLGTVGVTWISNPVCTELEMVTLNWLGKLLGLPEEFLNCSSGPGGGVIQGHASEAVFVCLSAAKDKMIRKFMSFNSSLNEDEIRSKLVAYSSDQSNSSVEKGLSSRFREDSASEGR
ncbi:unnamed protein product [Leptosia nina]|uniref:Uncharacterized protein n=1 Tax=Leptosia nina TaxID=320188 RepID=A0AAV1JDZ0_9NEOP